MSLDLNELKRLHDKAYNKGQVTRERASDDLVFYHVTQWDDNLLGESTLSYRGQFDILRKAGRQILTDLATNPIQIDFRPKATSRDDGADLMDGLYLSDDRRNDSIEAYSMSQQEAVVCGIGAWEIFSEYESNMIGDENQVITRQWLPEANNNVFWDPNAKKQDKSDAKYVSILEGYTEDGYKDLVEELTGERPEVTEGSFKSPEQSYVFPWFAGEQKLIYVTRFYHVKRVKDAIVTMSDPFGGELTLREKDIEDQLDELQEQGYEITSTREVMRNQVTRYIASGADILKEEVIAGQNIPVVPVFGERAMVEGEEHYEGITRLAKDPQRLRNFQMSYLADIASRSPRPKPIFAPEQIEGFEHMYEINGADNNYPYYLQHLRDTKGNPIPPGPAGMMPEQPIPQSLASLISLTREAVEDVANPGVAQSVSDPDISGKAVHAIQNQIEKQAMTYQLSMKHAKRRDAEIYASMASEVYDAPREVTLTGVDGKSKKASVMEAIIDDQTGEVKVLNDITNMEWDVYGEIGPSFSNMREKTIEQIDGTIQLLTPGDPMIEILLLKKMELMEGANFEDVQKYARNQLIIKGVTEPETEEEIAMLEAIQNQPQQPDPNMVLAEAEMQKAQADKMQAQIKQEGQMMKHETDRQKNEIAFFKAQTDRAAVQVDAQEANADIQYTNLKSAGQQVDNVIKAGDAFRGRLTPRAAVR